MADGKGKATAELADEAPPQPVEDEGRGPRPNNTKFPEYTRGLIHGLVVGIISGAAVAALPLLFTVIGDISGLEERMSTLEEDHPADLLELKCELYDQALELFDDSCTDGGGQFTAGVCNYPEPRNGKRTVRFQPPIQGLGRLCGQQSHR